MKNTVKNVLAVLLILCLLSVAIGCSAQAPAAGEPAQQAQPAPAEDKPAPEPTPEPTPEPLTAQEIIVKANNNIQEVKSLDATMLMDLDMEIMGERQATLTKSSMSVFTDPQRIKMNMEMSIGDEAVDMEMYMEQEGDTIYIYSYAMGEWISNSVDIGDYQRELSQYDVQGDLDTYIKNAKNFTSVGKENVNGVETEKIQGYLSGDDLSKALLESGSLDDMFNGGEIGVDELTAMFSDLDDMYVTIWVDTEKLMPVRFEFDMAKIAEAMFKNLFGAMGLEAEAIKVHKYNLSMEYINVGSATPFTVPPEAKEAA